MAYIPDGLAKLRRLDKVSPNARDIFEVYCEYADQDTAFAFPSISTVAKELDMRLDHAKDYNAELIESGWIIPQVLGNHEGYILKAGYLTRSQRSKNKQQPKPERESKPEEKPTEAPSQNLGNEPKVDGKDLPKTWGTSQNLGNMSENSTQDSGNSPQNLGTNSPNLGNISQNLGTAQELQNSEVLSEPASLTSILNQSIEPSIGEVNTSPLVGEGGKPSKARPEKPEKPETFGKLKATIAEKQAIEECFDFWVDLDSRKNTKLILDSDRWTATLKRLREGYTVEEIKSGIRGIKFSPHHQGKNDSKTKYDDLFHVCKSPENLERFIRFDADSSEVDSMAHLEHTGPSPPKNNAGNLSPAGASTAAKMGNIAKEWGLR